MALIDFQTALGKLVRGDDEPDAVCLRELVDTPGFRLTRRIQRSWCRGRAARAAHLTLSLLADHERHALLDEWIDQGGGRNSFFALEAEAFLEFIATRLRNPSQELTMCWTEHAVYRANRGAAEVRAPAPLPVDAASVLRRSYFASVVPMSGGSMLFAPHVPGLVRQMTLRELALWRAIEKPRTLAHLAATGHGSDVLTDFLAIGAAELLTQRPARSPTTAEP